LDNVLYEISNESDTESTAWQYHMIDYIKNYEAGKLKQHPVGMSAEFPGGNNADLFASPADWIAPNGDGGYGDIVPPADGTKVVVLDTDHIWGIGGDRTWAWKSFTRGYNVIYMDPWNGTFIPVDANPDLRVNMGYILSYAERMNLEKAIPHPELCSTGYCLANPTTMDTEYLVFLPAGVASASVIEAFGMKSQDHKRLSSLLLPADDKVTLDLSSSPVQLEVEWFNPADGSTYTGETVQGGASAANFSAPFSGEAVLYLHSTSSPVITVPPERQTTVSPKPTSVQSTATAIPNSPGTGLLCINGAVLFIILGTMLLFMSR